MPTRCLTSEINQIIADGEYYGMQTFDQSLGQLVVNGQLEYHQALNAATNPHDLKVMLGQLGVAPVGQTFVNAFAT